MTQIKFNEKSVQHNPNLFLMALLIPKAGSAPSTTHLTHTSKVKRWVNYPSKSMRVGEPGKAHPGPISGSLNLNFVTTFFTKQSAAASSIQQNLWVPAFADVTLALADDTKPTQY